MTLRTEVSLALLAIIVVVGLVMTVAAPIVWQRRAAATCAQLEQLKEIPFKSDVPTEDPIYLALRAHGRAAVPCLVERVTDVTPMPDPRQAPFYGGFAVGDAAVMMLVELGVPVFELLPESVRAKWTEQGVYAYFEYVEDPAHRLQLQKSLRERLSPGH